MAQYIGPNGEVEARQVHVRTDIGSHVAEPGDWIMTDRGVDWIVADEHFRQNYVQKFPRSPDQPETAEPSRRAG